MTVGDLINKLKTYDPKLPVCINDYMGFVEAYEETIIPELKTYITFPFTKHDEFIYLNLRSNKI